jgi:hypothetical protein
MTKTLVERLREARAAAFNEAADFAEFYGDERMRLCADAILHDPVFSGGPITRANIAKSRELQVDGTINSASYHAATHIAEHLRDLARSALRPDKG